jgi:hypothetical protein
MRMSLNQRLRRLAHTLNPIEIHVTIDLDSRPQEEIQDPQTIVVDLGRGTFWAPEYARLVGSEPPGNSAVQRETGR